MRRLLLPIALAAVALAVVPAIAQAEVKFRKCVKATSGECAYLSVPLDRSGAVPGKVSLYIERVKAFRQRRGVIIGLAGGPGEAAGALTREFARGLEPGIKHRDLLLYDQRGTGRSGALLCRAIEEQPDPFRADKEVASCARKLGAKRSFYTTRDSVADIEEIRSQLGVEKITLFGVSYGTKVALAYARAHPEHVERLILDSVLDVDGPDPFYLETIGAVPRVLNGLCRDACGGITQDPNGDLATLVKKLQAGPLGGTFIKATGRPTQTKLRRSDLLAVLLVGDFAPPLRAALPGAVRSALDGDPTPILRLRRRLLGVFGAPTARPRFDRGILIEEEEDENAPPDFSGTLFTATICEESALPWPRTTPPAERIAAARGAAAAIAEGRFSPFDRDTAIGGSDIIQLCEQWPAAPQPPALASGPVPQVPMLILNGEADLRTPLETAQRVQASVPGTTLLAVPHAGHSVLVNDLSGCALTAVRRFFRNSNAVTRCPTKNLFLPEPKAPTALSQVGPKGASGRVGRTLHAVELTLDDLRTELLNLSFSGAGGLDDQIRAGGLRAGRFIYNLGLIDNKLSLHGYSFIPGVRIDGLVRGFDIDRNGKGTIKISGKSAAAGELKLRGTRLSGRLGGREVSVNMRKPPALPAEAAETAGASQAGGPGL